MRETLGQILIRKKLVPPDKVEAALRIQSGGNRRLGHILIKMGLISDEELFAALSDQQGIPIADIEKDIELDALKTLPRYMCKKYSVIPIQVEDNNILKLAMANPFDKSAIIEIDDYTGMLVKPSLSQEKDILNAIRNHMPLRLKDIIHPLITSRVTMALTGVVIALLITLSVFVYKEVQLQRYGTSSNANNLQVYSNLEMLIGVENGKAISLIGHGPYAKGFYSVVFDDVKSLKAFINENQANFTEQQYTWINWVADTHLKDIK